MSRAPRVFPCRVLYAVLSLLAWGTAVAHAQMADDARLKAAFLSKFPGFVDWPPSAWAHDTLVLCVTDRGPVQRHLEDLTRGEHLRGKPVVVRVLKPDQNPGACHVLFLSADSALGRDRLLAQVAALPVLTVSDDPAVFERGGIILLHAVGQRMRFTIDAHAADRCGLRLSSQLLGLAAEVRSVPR